MKGVFILLFFSFFITSCAALKNSIEEMEITGITTSATANQYSPSATFSVHFSPKQQAKKYHVPLTKDHIEGNGKTHYTPKR